jgi:hypothetical protein
LSGGSGRSRTADTRIFRAKKRKMSNIQAFDLRSDFPSRSEKT